MRPAASRSHSHRITPLALPTRCNKQLRVTRHHKVIALPKRCLKQLGIKEVTLPCESAAHSVNINFHQFSFGHPSPCGPEQPSGRICKTLATIVSHRLLHLPRCTIGERFRIWHLRRIFAAKTVFETRRSWPDVVNATISLTLSEGSNARHSLYHSVRKLLWFFAQNKVPWFTWRFSHPRNPM